MDKFHLGLRWLSHELANGLSVLRSSLDMEEKAMADDATNQLIGLLRLTQLATAQSEVGTDHWQESVRAVAKVRGVEVSFQCDDLSFQQLQALTSLFLALLPRVVSGTITFLGNSTKTAIAASAVLDRVQEEIATALASKDIHQSKLVPFYLARTHANAIQLERKGEGIELRFEAG